MRLIFPILCALLLTGCATARQINPGADLPIYAASPLRIQEEWLKRGGEARFGIVTNGFYDRQRNEIWIRADAGKWQTAAWLVHEVGHVREDPAHWRVIYALSSDRFNTKSTYHD